MCVPHKVFLPFWGLVVSHQPLFWGGPPPSGGGKTHLWGINPGPFLFPPGDVKPKTSRVFSPVTRFLEKPSRDHQNRQSVPLLVVRKIKTEHRVTLRMRMTEHKDTGPKQKSRESSSENIWCLV